MMGAIPMLLTYCHFKSLKGEEPFYLETPSCNVRKVKYTYYCIKSFNRKVFQKFYVFLLRNTFLSDRRCYVQSKGVEVHQ